MKIPEIKTARDVPCEMCGAPAGVACRDENGEKLKTRPFAGAGQGDACHGARGARFTRARQDAAKLQALYGHQPGVGHVEESA